MGATLPDTLRGMAGSGPIGQVRLDVRISIFGITNSVIGIPLRATERHVLGRWDPRDVKQMKCRPGGLPSSWTKLIQNCLSSQGITCTHSIHMNLEFTSSIAIPALSCQSHEPLMIPNRRARIRFRDNQARTDDFHHVKVTLYH
eukprot:Gb_19368 [translate_table: standard]